jgi:hypothetical protein
VLAHRVAALTLAGADAKRTILLADSFSPPNEWAVGAARRPSLAGASAARPASCAGGGRRRGAGLRGENCGRRLQGSCRPVAPASPQPPHARGVESALV